MLTSQTITTVCRVTLHSRSDPTTIHILLTFVVCRILDRCTQKIRPIQKKMKPNIDTSSLYCDVYMKTYDTEISYIRFHGITQPYHMHTQNRKLLI